jgi:hypothetical protein
VGLGYLPILMACSASSYAFKNSGVPGSPFDPDLGAATLADVNAGVAVPINVGGKVGKPDFHFDLTRRSDRSTGWAA